MATHYVRHHAARRPIDWLVDLTLSLLAVWLEFWRSTEPDQPEPAHEGGATEEFAADLHDWNDPESTVPMPVLLAEHDEPVLCGWLVGNPYDQNGGGV